MKHTPPLLLLTVGTLSFACTDIDEPRPGEGENQETATATTTTECSTPHVEGNTVLSEKIEIPYTTENMRRALASLKAGNKSTAVGGLTEDSVCTTHLYLRFAPRDSTDVLALETDTTIMFTDIPMDRDIVAIGDYYHDPSLPDSVPTYQYCAVRLGQSLPDVPHETLAELFLLEETNVYDEAEPEAGNKAADPLWENLEAEAYSLVGLSDYLEDEPTVGNKAKWRPGGCLKYEDSQKGIIPLEGVPIRYHKLVIVHQCCTDAAGNFNFGRRRGKVRYYAKWQRDNFRILGVGNVFKTATTDLSGNTSRRIDHVIGNPGSNTWKYASVFRAAHTYYYKHGDYGLSRPEDKNLTIRLSEMTPTGRNSRFIPIRMLGMSEIKVYHRKLPSSDGLFHSTFHEIAHSAHYRWSRFDYASCGDKVRESWARGAAWFVTNKLYPEFSAQYYDDYTGIVQSLVGGEISKIDTKDGKLVEIPKVGPFTMSQIEKTFKGSRSWGQWAKKVEFLGRDKNERENIRKLFDAWGNCQ